MDSSIFFRFYFIDEKIEIRRGYRIFLEVLRVGIGFRVGCSILVFVILIIVRWVYYFFIIRVNVCSRDEFKDVDVYE